MTDNEAYLKYKNTLKTSPDTALFVVLDGNLEVKQKYELTNGDDISKYVFECYGDDSPYVVINRIEKREVIHFELKSLSRTECLHTGKVEYSEWIDRAAEKNIDMKKVIGEFEGLKKLLAKS